MLPSELFDALDKACPDVTHAGKSIDAVTGERQDGMRGPDGSGQKAWNADRTVMRKILLTGLDDHIEFGKKFERYEFSDDNGITAYFVDGTSVLGKMLVGADGVRSSVRRQLVPEQVMLDTEVRAVFGKTPIGDGSVVPEGIDQGITVISSKPPPHPEVKLFCDGMRFDRSRTNPGVNNVDLPEDYIFWVLLFQSSSVAISAQELLSDKFGGEKSLQLAEELTKTWRESNRAVIVHADPSAVATLAFEMARPDLEGRIGTSTSTTDCRVTLLGDAAHPMPPVGALGANAAFEDAAQLAELLAVAGQSQCQLDEEKLRGFEKDVRDRARRALGQVAGPGRGLLGMKPIEELKPSTLWT
ncbi:hypothetical protein LTR99_005412 [Exophiala xenobiotica]|uniref:FAD-binding domain-containing protein n=1 Tax=Vermiconidia calcicola TaxID=1690605 RepID=A0AAV9Q7W5_9PEZI|nr:hypothetical protein LTR99_005412 [Exophiala xenobiotica]KAK5535827.1 hypothetical protein LTR25_005729 [Vermiconidia calcicola]KAK5548767.1 hypothetical protein LTR23_001256 [Chaetothyriales sp. CCFEE 6169]KAK5364299.1 hypothetical protein LTS13_008913 [Exophiala xenobiotica]KAK5399010.1 hypothetical protein LTR79_004008 [Exophiala xenobiotica]